MKGGKATEKQMQVIKNGIETRYKRLSNIYHKKRTWVNYLLQYNQLSPNIYITDAVGQGFRS